MNIVLYLRKSSEEEEKQFNSTKDQKKKCLAYVEGIGNEIGKKLKIVKTYEEHHSAAHAGERDYFNEMLDGIRAGKFDAILAYHPDRLSRNMLEAGILLDMVRPEKGEEVGMLQDLLFPTVSFNNDSGGRLMLAVLFSMATQYSDHLSEVVQRGVTSTRQQGKSSGAPKWGYTRNRVTGYYEPDQNFELIKKGWQMFLDGSSQVAILNFLRDNDVHYYTVETTNKPSRKISINHKNQIGRILKDTLYYGVNSEGGETIDLREIPEANFKPMITEEEYDKAQAILDSGFQSHSKRKGEDGVFVPFQGMVICAECGRKLYGYANKKRKLIYYGHQNANHRDCPRLNDKKSTNEVRGNIIIDEIHRVLDQLKPTKQEYRRYLKMAKDFTDSRKEELQIDIRSCVGTISQYKNEQKEEVEYRKQLMKNPKTPAVVLAETDRKINDLQMDIDRVTARLNELKDKRDRPEKTIMTEKDFLNLLENASQQMEDYDFVGKDILLRKLFLNLQIDKENKVSFLCKPEFDGLIKTSDVHNGGDMWT